MREPIDFPAFHINARLGAGFRAIASAVLLLVAGAAAADEVRLLNGDRITGEVVEKSGERVVVRTRYAGEISIEWSEVASIATDRPIRIMLGADGERTVVRGRLVPQDDGGLVLESPSGAARRLALGDIDFINPALHETGEGTTYSGRLAVSAAYSSGNTESERLYLDGQLAARALEYGYGLSAKVERRSDEELEANTAWLLGGNYDRFLGAEHFAYVRSSFEHDRAKDIDLRSTTGLGYGRHLFDSPGFKLTLRGGVDYVDVDRLAAEDESYPAFGWGVSATWVPWSARVELFHEQDGFLNLQDTDTVLIRSRTGVRVPLVARLNATAQVNIDWERTPAPGRVRTDRTLLLGVDYAF